MEEVSNEAINAVQWWRTGEAYALAGALMGGALTAFIGHRLRLNQIKKEKEHERTQRIFEKKEALILSLKDRSTNLYKAVSRFDSARHIRRDWDSAGVRATLNEELKMIPDEYEKLSFLIKGSLPLNKPEGRNHAEEYVHRARSLVHRLTARDQYNLTSEELDKLVERFSQLKREFEIHLAELFHQ
jgi:hypothetical protein